MHIFIIAYKVCNNMDNIEFHEFCSREHHDIRTIFDYSNNFLELKSTKYLDVIHKIKSKNALDNFKNKHSVSLSLKRLFLSFKEPNMRSSQFAKSIRISKSAKK